MRRILVAIDGTPASRGAARVALEFAASLGKGVTFVHVLPERVSERTGEASEFAAFERACEQYAEALLKETCVNLGDRSCSTTTRVEHGDPAKVLCALAAEDEVELVIVGTRARGPLARTLLGSVSEELMCRCPKPVLVVPERSLLEELQPAASSTRLHS
jgi:nucleotide-binding universal stress UspA family protein